MGRVQRAVVLHMLRLIVFLAVLQVSHAFAGDLENQVDAAMEQAREAAKQMQVPVNKHEKEAEQTAREVARQYNAPSFQEKLRCEQDRLQNLLYPEEDDSQDEQESTEDEVLAKDEKVYLFFSSSVPEETMQAYVEDAARTKDPRLMLLMRGFAKNKPKYLGNIIKQDITCQDDVQANQICPRNKVRISLRPELFTRYGVARVPAVVYVKDAQAYRIQGDAGFEYFLEIINREAKSKGLADLISKLRSGK